MRGPRVTHPSCPLGGRPHPLLLRLRPVRGPTARGEPRNLRKRARDPPRDGWPWEPQPQTATGRGAAGSPTAPGGTVSVWATPASAAERVSRVRGPHRTEGARQAAGWLLAPQGALSPEGPLPCCSACGSERAGPGASPLKDRSISTNTPRAPQGPGPTFPDGGGGQGPSRRQGAPLLPSRPSVAPPALPPRPQGPLAQAPRPPA